MFSSPEKQNWIFRMYDYLFGSNDSRFQERMHLFQQLQKDYTWCHCANFDRPPLFLFHHVLVINAAFGNPNE